MDFLMPKWEGVRSKTKHFALCLLQVKRFRWSMKFDDKCTANGHPKPSEIGAAGAQGWEFFDLGTWMTQKEHFPVSLGFAGFHPGATWAPPGSSHRGPPTRVPPHGCLGKPGPLCGDGFREGSLVLLRDTWYIEKILRKDTDAEEDSHTLDRQDGAEVNGF